MPRKKKPKTNSIPDSDYDVLVERMSKCHRLLEELRTSEAWKILTEDMQFERQRLDDTWQSLTEEKQLHEARVLKMAVMHILKIPEKYEAEYNALKSQKEDFDNIDKKIIKDYDGETNIE